MELSRIHYFVDYLRTRSIAARHAILWGGSLLLFICVFALWVGQIRYKLATAFQFQPTALVALPLTPREFLPAKDLQTEGERSSEVEPAKESLEDELTGVIGLMKKGTAGLFSFIKGSSFFSDSDSRREGEELDQFLKYQKEYYRPFQENE